MASLLEPDQPIDSGLLGPPPRITPPDPGNVDWADAVSTLQQAIEAQRAQAAGLPGSVSTQFAGNESGNIWPTDPSPEIASKNRSFDAPVFIMRDPYLPKPTPQPSEQDAAWAQRTAELEQRVKDTDAAYQSASMWTSLLHPELYEQWVQARQELNAHMNASPQLVRALRHQATQEIVPQDVEEIMRGVTQRQRQGRGEWLPAPDRSAG